MTGAFFLSRYRGRSILFGFFVEENIEN